jgi:ABC-type transport system involved in multi-copper enzyme maturation permease subunit
MARISNIALNTFRESIRGRIFYLVLVFGGILIFATYLLSPLSVGSARDKIITDVGLAMISFLGVVTAIIAGSTLVYQEVDKKLVYMVLTRPVSRIEFLAGKFFGIMATLFLMISAMAAMLVILIITSGGGLSSGIFAAVYMSILEVAVISSIVILFSTFTTPVLTFFFAVCVFAVGSLSGDLRTFAQRFGPSSMKSVMDTIYYLLPNLKLFNLRHEAVHGIPFDYSDIALATVYALSYCGAVMIFAYLIFRRREFS